MTSIWGAKYWNFFHLITTLYPNKPSIKDKIAAITFLNTIDKVLPCNECAKHFRSNIKKYRTKNDLASKKNFIKWFIDFHNHVNKMLKKKISSYNESIKLIKKINKNVIKHLEIILGFVTYILPSKGKIEITRIRGIQKFIKSIIQLGKIKIKGNLNIKFNDKKSYIKMYRQFIKKLVNK